MNDRIFLSNTLSSFIKTKIAPEGFNNPLEIEATDSRNTFDATLFQDLQSGHSGIGHLSGICMMVRSYLSLISFFKKS
jgi:hypothetical protein